MQDSMKHQQQEDAGWFESGIVAHTANTGHEFCSQMEWNEIMDSYLNEGHRACVVTANEKYGTWR